MIFDVHCHILPGVDDGARDEGSTERMLNIARENGIDGIIATPHFEYGQEKETLEGIKKKYSKVRDLWKEMGPDKELFLGHEVFYSEGVVDSLKSGVAMTMNDTRYVLIEFRVDVGHSYALRAIQKLRYAGYYPIIAHVERYPKLRSGKTLQELIEKGAHLQVNASTLCGEHGFIEKYRMMRLVKLGLIDFVATDAHDSRARRPKLKECMEILKKQLGEEKVRLIFEENPIRMLRGEELNG